MRGPLISYYLSISSPGSRYKRIPRVSYFAHQLPPSQQDIGYEARASGTPRVAYLPGQDAGYHVRPSATIYLSIPSPPCRPGAERQLVPDIPKNPARQLLLASASYQGRIEDTTSARQVLSIYPPCRPGAARQLLCPSATRHGRIEDAGPVRQLPSIYLFPPPPYAPH